MPRIAFQNVLDNWFKTAQAVTDTVAYAQTISVTDGALSAQPMKVDYSNIPQLTSADFSSIRFTGGGATQSGVNKEKTGEQKVAVAVDVKVTPSKEFNTIVSQNQAVTLAMGGI